MAVAVKTSPGARSESPTGSPAILSLIGVAYLLGCLALVFKVIPWLWWAGFDALSIPSKFNVEAGALLVVACLAAGLGLLSYGGRLLGPNPPVGVRGGVFLGFVGLLMVVLLSRWVSLWAENWVDRGVLPFTVGVLISAAAALLLVVGLIRLLATPRVLGYAVTLDEGGWFQAKSYKPNQGRHVRRGTILGILILVVAGIWTMISHGLLRRMPDDWAINIPFTGQVAVTDLGGMSSFLVAAEVTPEVEVRTPGATNLRVKEVISGNEFIAAVEKEVGKDKALEDEFLATRAQIVKEIQESHTPPAEKKISDKNVTATVLTVNRLIRKRMGELLALKGTSRLFENESAIRRLRDAYNQGYSDDVREAVMVFEKAAKDFGKTEELGAVFSLPTGLLILDRGSLQQVNKNADKDQYVRIGLTTDRRFDADLPYDKIISTEVFDKAEVKVYNAIAFDKLRLEFNGPQGVRAEEIRKDLEAAKTATEFKDKVKGHAQTETGGLKRVLGLLETDLEVVTPPKREPLQSASGNEHFASVPLLPAVKYTLPVLLLVASIWLAWRVVNMPAFADFLIATEAEMNKVSWTTQKRLVQDTIVVLATMLLMAVFLFAMDMTWKKVLGWDKIGVLYIPTETEDKQVEQKKW